MVRLGRLLKGAGPDMVQGVAKEYLKAEREISKKVRKANEAFRKKKNSK